MSNETPRMRITTMMIEQQPYQEFKTFFPSIAGQNPKGFLPVGFGRGNGVFTYSNTPARIQMDPHIKRHLLLPYFNPHDRNTRQKLSNKYLMSHRVLADLIKDPSQAFLNSLRLNGINTVETRHVVVRNGPPAALERKDVCIESYGAYWNSHKNAWCCMNYRYVPEGEIHGYTPWILAFVPPKQRRRQRCLLSLDVK